MPDGPDIRSLLARPGLLSFPSNLPFARNLEAAKGSVVRQSTGHLVFYGPGHRRFLATDPDGNPLHECEWVPATGGALTLARARVRLDWGQWVGLQPRGLVNATRLDLSQKPGWQRLQADDLREMAARAMQVPLEEVRFFYGDDDLLIDARGQATIRQKKDAFLVLDDGTFGRTRFMACMGAMHWEKIDFLPVVELFQSLLPGTGSAAFELIRGLYDDQNEGRAQPLPLRYRGIPTYPSEAAYRLFSAFFTPQAPGGGDPFPLFMDGPRAHQVTWLPRPEPPLRYFDADRRLCATIAGGAVQKVTLAEDPTGLSFVSPGPDGFAACERAVVVTGGRLLLTDREEQAELPTSPAWGSLRDSPVTVPAPQPLGWRELFRPRPPEVEPARAFAAVLLYPDTEAEIDEASSQPFVADYLQDLLEQRPDLAARLAKADAVLVHNFDAALASCFGWDRPRDYTILYHRPDLAQRQAQLLWNPLARSRRLDWARRIALWPEETGVKPAYDSQYDVIYRWILFSRFTQPMTLSEAARALAAGLKPGGLAFVTGPASLARTWPAHPLRLLRSEPVETLPTFRMHRTILPKARLKPGLTLFHLQRG